MSERDPRVDLYPILHDAKDVAAARVTARRLEEKLIRTIGEQAEEHSLRSLAKSLGCSHVHLHQVIKGKQQITSRLLNVILSKESK